LTVDDVTIQDLGDTMVGEHRFVLLAPNTDRDVLALRVSAHHDLFTATLGFGAAPMLVAGAQPQRGYKASIGSTLAIAGITLAAIFAFLFATLFVMDRRNRADAAFAVMSFGAILTICWGCGLGPAWLLFADSAAVGLGILYFVHLEFSLGPPPRLLRIAWYMLGVLSPLAGLSLSVAAAEMAVMFVVGLPHMAYIFWRLFRLMHEGPKADVARILFAANVVSTVGIGAFQLAILSGSPALQGLHVEFLGVIAWAIAQALIKSRHLIARQREIERVNVELQRKVAERSRDLAEALAKLAEQPQTLDDRRLIDGRYRIIRKLGAGGMGSVHEVERVTDGHRLALKSVRGRVDARVMARFAREAQLAAQL